MIKKTLLSLFISALVSLSAIHPSLAQETPTPSPPPEPTSLNSYDLFWPVVAGKVPGDSFYFLKELKWKLKGLIIFSDLRKADYHLTLSKKRIVETEKLIIEKQDYSRAATTTDKAYQELQEATLLTRKLQEKGKKTADIHSAILANGENEADFLRLLITQVPNDQKEPFTSTANSMEKLLSEFKNL